MARMKPGTTGFTFGAMDMDVDVFPSISLSPFIFMSGGMMSGRKRGREQRGGFMSVSVICVRKVVGCHC